MLTITEEQQLKMNWLRAKVIPALDQPMRLITNYRENSPQYLGENLDELLEQAMEDYADWDES